LGLFTVSHLKEWIEALLLGAVQGVTEFLPISSDGHLLIVQQAFAQATGVVHSGKQNLFFDVMLHAGTLAAIVIYYRAVVRTGAKGLLGSDAVPPAYRRNAVLRVGLLACIATAPLVPLKLFFIKWIEKTFESTTAAGVGFLITAAVLLVTATLRNRGEGGKGPAEMSWLDAFLIGIAQMFAPLPGVSRSGVTVAAALGLGLSRAWAVGFSLLIAVPAILGATVFELKDVDPATLTSTRVAQIVAAAALAGIVGYGAIIWLVKIVRSGRLWYFSVYLIVVGTAVLAASLSLSSAEGATPDARHEKAAYRIIRRGDPRPGVERFQQRRLGSLGGTDASGAQPGAGVAGAVSGAGASPPGILLGGHLAARG
jgi:undecaprenyl-diphosphatase